MRLSTCLIAAMLAVAATFPLLGVSQAKAQQPLVVDHHSSLQFHAIPKKWIDAAKNLTFHYGHTSHGSQIMSGLEYLEGEDPNLSFATKYGGAVALPAAETPPALRIFDGQQNETYITPDLYWDGATGVNLTNQAANTGLFDFSMWSWCTQQSYNSEVTVNSYLSTMDGFQAAHPGMRFIFMTGVNNSPGPTLTRNNQMVIDHAKAVGGIVFDVADIEKYDPLGGYHPDATDTCDWCPGFCTEHPELCPSHDFECAHSHELVCQQKARAFWWLAARLAGWNGPANTAGVMLLMGQN